MASYQLTSPDGTKYKVNAPDNASQDEVLSFFKSQLEQPQAPVNPIGDMLDRSGADTQRLINTGVTPGNAVEFAAAHIQDLKGRGIDVSPQRQLAIQDLYKREAGRTDLSSRDVVAEQTERKRQEKFDTVLGRAEVAARRVANLGPQAAGNLIGTVAPETGKALQERGDEIFGTGQAPSGVRDLGLSLGAEALKLRGYAAAGPEGMAALYGAEGFGGQRIEASKLRERGLDVSLADELKTAGGVGAVEAVSGYVGGKIFQGMASSLQAASPAFKNMLQGGSKKAVQEFLRQGLSVSGHMIAEGSEEAVTQMITNKIRSGIDPQVAMWDGVAEAFAMGVILSPLGADAQMGRDTDSEADLVENGPAGLTERGVLPESTPQAVPPANALERRLVGQEGTAPASTPLEQQMTGQQAVEPTLEERDRFFGTGTSEATLTEEAKFFRAKEPEQSQASEPRTVQEAQMTGLPFEGEQATAPRRRRKSKVNPDGFDERSFFKEDEVTQLKRQLAEQHQAARTDSLTGLGNKREYDETLAKHKKRTDDTGKPFSVLLFDAANLKAANDVLGHEGADGILQRIAGTLRTASRRRPGDAVATRQGGDEFAIILPDTDAKGAQEVMRKIEQEVGRTQIIPGLSMFLAGDVATYDGQNDFDKALQTADHGVEARKRLAKQQYGEVTERSEAEALIKGHKTRQASPAMQESVKEPESNKVVQATAQEYTDEHNLPTPTHTTGSVSDRAARRIAQEYQDMEHDPTNPAVAESYEAFTRETLDQFNHLKSKGYVFESWEGEGQPYANVAEMAADLAENRHLYYFPTAEGFGSDGQTRSDHPMLQTAPGTGGMTHNDVFRAVHDVYGHAKHGHGFDIKGEENAWRSHSPLYSDAARGALTTETRGQSTWVGYGPNGPANQKALAEGREADIVFAPQKAGLLPTQWWNANGLRPIEDYAPKQEASEKTKSLGAKIRGMLSKTPRPHIQGEKTRWSSGRIPNTLDEYIDSTVAAIEDISPRVAGRIWRMEYQAGRDREVIRRQMTKWSKKVIDDLGSEKTPRHRQWKKAVLEGRREDAKALLNEETHESFDRFYDTFAQLLALQRDAGVTIGDLGEGYWPRYIRDYRSFRKLFGRETGAFEAAINLAKSLKGRLILSADEKTETINSVLQGYGPRKPGSAGIPNARARVIEEIDEDMVDHYVNPVEAAMRYVDGAVYNAARTRFLGRNARDPESLAESVGSTIEEEVDTLSPEQQDALKDLLQTRFLSDMLTVPKSIRLAKQAIYMLTLGQFRSTITQLADIAMTVRDYGALSTIQGLKAATGLTAKERRLMMEDIGIHDHGEEFKDIGKLASTTDAVFRKTGFKRLDRFGKETRTNAALESMRKAARGGKTHHLNYMRERYIPLYGKQWFRDTMSDLANGKITEDIRMLALIEVGRVQPVTMSQMPQRYLSSPRGRLFYTLKTFMLQQIQHFRRDVLRDLAGVNRRRGVKNLGRFITMHALLGLPVELLKELLRGREIAAEDFPDKAVASMLNGVGLSTFTFNMASRDPQSAVASLLLPPMPLIQSGVGDIFEGFTGRSSTMPWMPATEGSKVVGDIPLVGQLLYYWSPIGEGYHRDKASAKRDYRNKLKMLRSEAAQYVGAGDPEQARYLLSIYNDRRKQGPGDGRKSPLIYADLLKDIKRQEDNSDGE